MNALNMDGLRIIKGVTGSGLSRTLAEIKARRRVSAFISWHKKLKDSDQRPRGKFFKSRHATNLKRLRTLKLEEPI